LKHYAAPGFWEAFDSLDPAIQKAARGAFHLMKSDPRHPGVRLKKTGRFWSARVNSGTRSLAVEHDGKLIWFWIGAHGEYEQLIKRG